MVISGKTNRLHAELALMIRVETAVEERMAELITIASEHPGVGALLTEFLSLPREHRKALETRLNTLAGPVPASAGNAIDFPTDAITAEISNPVTTALQQVYTMFNRAMIGYSILRVHATRFLDWVGDEGTSNHLAEQFTTEYAQAIQKIIRMLHDVIIWELDRDGYDCQCICPSCGPGICLCSISARFLLHNAWNEAGSFYEGIPVFVQQPKKDSPAEIAGLQRGHLITGMNDTDFESWGELYEGLESAKSGDEVRLKIRKESGTSDVVTLKLP